MMIEKPVINFTIHGSPVAIARIKDVNDEFGIAICDLVDAAGKVLATDRYFKEDEAPFSRINQEDRAALGIAPVPVGDANAGLPSTSWSNDEIKDWLTLKGVKYPASATKTTLLEKVSEYDGQA